MTELPTVTVDVRDMLCAQALAVVARTMGHLSAGDVAAVVYSTDDVASDLCAWAREQGHVVRHVNPTLLEVERTL